MTSFILRALIAALGLWLATEWVDGISVNSPTTLILAAVLLGIVNAIVRPLAILLTLPLTLITLGFFLLVVNAAMVGLVAVFLPGMAVQGFWAAFWTAILVSIVSWIGNAMFRPDQLKRRD
ncbi:MAG: phage holin family protein [Gammaproteobacteria bacterium]|nr:phage holin family protein [Gammaproteobacteria bacterium]